MINAITRYYERDNANIHRGVHFLSEHATEEHDEARAHDSEFSERRGLARKSFSCAAPPKPSTWWRKPTGAAHVGGRRRSAHHRHGAPLEHRAVADSLRRKGREAARRADQRRGELLLDEYANLLGPKTKIVAVTHVSNALGSITPLRRMIELAHAQNIPVLVDGAQAVPHMKVDVQALDCDFYAFSGHKVYGPTGIGVLYGKVGAARSDASLPGRRRHDQLGDIREDALQQAALQIRSRHAGYLRRDRPGRGDSLRGRARHRADRRARTRPARIRHAKRFPRFRACA